MTETVDLAEFRAEPEDGDHRVRLAARHAREFLRALGVATDHPSMRRSPLRMAQAYAELLAAPDFDATTFANDEDYAGLVLVRDIPVRSVCEHHLLPFVGVAHLGYLPGERLLGLSKFARVVEHFARRPQVQERLTTQIAHWLVDELDPRGVGVVIDAEHTCMTLRGVRAAGTRTRTSTLLGALQDDSQARAEFLAANPMEEGGPPMTESVVVVGAGLAAAHVVQTLREEGFAGSVALVGDEPERPYERPGLSKQVLLEAADADSLFVHEEGYYAEHDVVTHFGDAAVALDRSDRTVRLASGADLGYDALVLATGARPRTLELPGSDLDGVLTLRRLGDCARLRAELQPGRRVVIVGGGWIGLEVAAAARSYDCEVTVLEAGDRPLGAVLGPLLADHFAAVHRAHGVSVRTRSGVQGFTGRDGRVHGVLVDGEELPADIVLVGVGAIPNTQLAEAAGLDLDRGVLADALLRTSDPAVLAVGDVVRAQHTSLGRLRVEHWDNAIKQGELAARTILGQDARFDWQPYFFTDQYDLGMEYVGQAGAEQEVVLRGDPAGGEFLAFWLDGERVRAAMNVNIWDVNDTLRALIGREFPRAALTDPAVSLEDLARA